MKRSNRRQLCPLCNNPLAYVTDFLAICQYCGQAWFDASDLTCFEIRELEVKLPDGSKCRFKLLR